MESTIKPVQLDVKVVIQGPGVIKTELIAAGFFILEKDEVLIGGAKQLNDGLKGRVMELRTNGDFGGHAGEIYCFTPEENTIPAGKILLLGLGARSQVTLQVLHDAGRLAVVHAHQLAVEDFAFAPEVRDAGVTHLPSDGVAQSVIEGVLEHFQEITSQGSTKLKTCFLLAGQHIRRVQRAE